MFFTSYHSFSRHHRKKAFTGLASACAVAVIAFSLSPNESLSSQSPADSIDNTESVVVSEQVTITDTTDKSVEQPLVFAYATPTGETAEKQPQQEDKSESALETILKNIPFTQATAPDPITNKKPDQTTVTLNRGDTLMGLLTDNGASRSNAYEAIEAMRPFYSPRNIRAGQEITLYYKHSDETGRYLSGYAIETSPIVSYVIMEKHDGGYTAQKKEKPLTAYLESASGTIESSLSEAGEKAGVPLSVVNDLIHVYSWDIDFQRDIRKGDTFEVLYERSYDNDGNALLTGNVLYANLTVRGKDVKIYRQALKDGTVDYFKEDGISVKRQLMRTPIDGARISSGFGLRKHPILGYSKKHEGLDFAAPRGTPIYAAGNGVIERAGPWSTFGNYVRIRHRSGLKTAYAHMHNIAKGIKAGVRVEQKQIIGYVGTTGRSTGPHLHYEVIKDGRKVNPARVDLPTGIELKGTELANLKRTISQVKKQYASVVKDGRIKVAGK